MHSKLLSLCVFVGLVICASAQNAGYTALPNNTVVKIQLTIGAYPQYSVLTGFLYGSGDASNTIKVDATNYDLFKFVQLYRPGVGQEYFVGFHNLNSNTWLGVDNYGSGPIIAYANEPNSWEFLELYQATTYNGLNYYYTAWAGLDSTQTNYVYYNFAAGKLIAPVGGYDSQRVTLSFIPAS